MHGKKGKYLGLAYVAPALLFVAIFTLYPFAQLIFMSLHDWPLLGGAKYTELRNYERMIDDELFWSSLLFTLKYTLYVTPIIIGLGFLFALLTTPNTALFRATRAVIFLPVVIGLGSSSLLWFWLFDQQVGLFNQLLVDLGVLARPMVWLSQEQRALWAVIISVVWKVVGFSMILFVASIQSVPHEITDAAKVDGAKYFQRVWRIILPMTSRTIVLVTLITIIGSMLAFDQFYIMTYGGPRNTTITSVYWIYTNSFTYFKLGYGAALSVFLTVLICLGAAVQLSLARRGSET